MTKKFDFSVLSIKQQHEKMTALLKYEQEILWEQLMREIDNALNGVWSTGCENAVDRIIANAMMVGPAPWKSITWPAVASGLWACTWSSAQLVNTPASVPIKELDQVEDLVSQGGMIEKKTLTYLYKEYAKTRAKLVKYVEKRRKDGDFNIDNEPEPECTCAMTESSMWACPKHGLDSSPF